jgi:hypothetical protein
MSNSNGSFEGRDDDENIITYGGREANGVMKSR